MADQPTLNTQLRRAGRERDPADALPAICALRKELDALERHHVACAVVAGWSWSRVAGALGVSKQAAHRKHSRTVRDLQLPDEPAAPGADEAAQPRMVVSADARRTVGVAREEARARGAQVVGTEHLLLAIMKVDSRAAAKLAGRGVTYDATAVVLQPTLIEEDQVAARRNRAAAEAGAATGVSALARTCLEQALREALARRSSRLEVGDLLLALLRASEGGATRTLTSLGVDIEALRADLGGAAPARG